MCARLIGFTCDECVCVLFVLCVCVEAIVSFYQVNDSAAIMTLLRANLMFYLFVVCVLGLLLRNRILLDSIWRF